MQSRCTICNHPLVNDINLAVLSGDYTLDELSQKFGRSRSAFHRHKGHLEKKMRRCLERQENHRKQVSLLKLSSFLDHVERRVEAAAADGDTDRVYKGSHIGSRIIHQINKMDLPLELDTAYRLISSPDLVSHDSILPTSPQIIAALHQALVDQTLAPCPPPAENEAAASHPEGPPVPEKIVLPLPHAPASKHQRRQAAKAARKDRQLLRQSLRQQKHLLNGKKASTNPFSLVPLPCLLTNVEREKHPQGGEAQALPAFLELYAPLEARNPELETPLDTPLPETGNQKPETATDPSSLFPDPCLLETGLDPDLSYTAAKDLSVANAREHQPHKSGIKAKRERWLLRKMLRHQRLISKSKNFVQNFIAGWQSEKTPVPKKTLLPPDPLETRNPELEIPLLTTPKQGPEFEPEICLLETPNQKLKTGFQKPKTENWLLKTANRLLSKPKPPPPCDETARRADELFEISHGYKRHNPPKHIPDRRRDEDFRSRTIFGDVNNTLKHMLG